MENQPLDDRCTQPTGRPKTAAGITVYLLEELGDARLRCAQLKKLVSDAQDLIEKSEQRDHIFEIAAHLIHGIPDNLFRMEKALGAAAMAAARLDYEEIKLNLKPEKVEELENVLQDARLRYLTRRAEEVSNATVAAEEIERFATLAEQTGVVPVDDLLVFVAALEHGAPKAVEAKAERTVSEQLLDIAASVRRATNPKRADIAKTLRLLLARGLQPTGAQTLRMLMRDSSSREKVMEGFKGANPDLSDEQLEVIADHWEKHKDTVKDQHKTAAEKYGQTAGDIEKKLDHDVLNLLEDLLKTASTSLMSLAHQKELLEKDPDVVSAFDRDMGDAMNQLKQLRSSVRMTSTSFAMSKLSGSSVDDAIKGLHTKGDKTAATEVFDILTGPWAAR